MAIVLSNLQVEELARPLVDEITAFFQNPTNQVKYREWHLQKYGCEPKDGNE